jgi:hypothetical protein
VSTPVLAALAVGLAATLGALLFDAAARLGWAVGAGMVAVAVILADHQVAGIGLLGGVVVATVVEVPGAAPPRNFNTILGRLGALVLGLFGALVVVVRLLSLDVAQNLHVVVLVAMGLLGLLFMLVQPGPALEARAARAVLVVAAGAWAMAGHPGAEAAGAAALLLVLLALAPRPLAER